MHCPKCGAPVDSTQVICQECRFILDTDFLGDGILDDLDQHRPGSGGINARELNVDRISYLERKLPEQARHKSRDVFEHISDYAAGKSLIMVAPGAVPEQVMSHIPQHAQTPFQHLLLTHIDGEKPIETIAAETPLSLSEVRLHIEEMIQKKWIKVPKRVHHNPQPQYKHTDRDAILGILELYQQAGGRLGHRHPLLTVPLSDVEYGRIQKTQQATTLQPALQENATHHLPKRVHPSQEQAPIKQQATAIANKKRRRKPPGLDSDEAYSQSEESAKTQHRPQPIDETHATSFDEVPDIDTDLIDESMIIRSLHTRSGRPVPEAEDVRIDRQEDSHQDYQQPDRAMQAIHEAVEAQLWPQAYQIGLKAISRWPGHPEFFNALGVIVMQDGQHQKEAIGYFKKALVLAPKNNEYRRNLRRARKVFGETAKKRN